MHVLFLDQNKWIDLARVAQGRVADASTVLVYEQLCSAVKRGLLIVPLTATHIIETAKRNDLESRKAVAEVQARLSKGFVFRSRKARLLIEMRNALHVAFGEPRVELPENWAVVPGFMQAFETFDTLVATPKQAAESRLINDHIDPQFQYLEYMTNQNDEWRRKAVAAFSSESDSLLSRIEERRKIMIDSPNDLRYRAYAAKLFFDHQGYVAHMLDVIGHTVDEMKGLGTQAIAQFVRNVPTLNVEAEIAARLEAQIGSLEPNDILDVQSFYTAIPYSGRLVAEKNFISLARQAKLNSNYDVVLHTKVDELMNIYP